MNFAPGQHEERSSPKTDVSDEQLLALKPLKPRKKATFDSPTPSKFCHICCRTPSRGIRLAVCADIVNGQCRKVICEKCFTDYDLGCTYEQALLPQTGLKCTHCRNICPERAQCRTYQNVNKKLRLKRLRQCAVSDEAVIYTNEMAREGASSATAKISPTFARPISSNIRKTLKPGLPLLRALPLSRTMNTNKPAVQKEIVMMISGNSSPNSVAPRSLCLPSTLSVGRTIPQGGGGKGESKPYFSPERSQPKELKPMPLVCAPSTEASDTQLLTTCHLCGKNASHPQVSSFVNCDGVYNPECRKAFCNLCREKYSNVFSVSGDACEREKRWNCLHCTKYCPDDSMCRTYSSSATHNSEETAKGLPISALVSIRRKHNPKASLKSRLLAAVSHSF